MFKAPNIHGPRFRKEFRNILSRDLHKKFLTANPKYTGLTYEQFRNIIISHSGKMWMTAATTRDGIQLPIGGTIFVGSTKVTKKNNYDMKASVAANAPIKHRNNETDGYVAKVFYTLYLSKVGGRDRSLWSFKGGRQFTRTVAQEYPKRWNTHIVVEHMDWIVKNYKRHQLRSHNARKTERAIKTYNEFDL